MVTAATRASRAPIWSRYSATASSTPGATKSMPKKRSSAPKPPALEATARKVVTGMGAPS